jgi:TRAP-type C4-dicarboxylate transport system substrate-binding protein
MKRILLLALFALVPAVAHAGEVTIKLGTLAPEGSAWHNHLRALGEKWTELSGGQVKVKIYPGGVVGNEADMVRKLRINQLHAALLTGTGIHDIDPAVQALQVPMMLKTDAEVDYVTAKLAPKLEKLLDDKGYVVIHWGDAGWVTFFSQKPAKTPEEMKDQKVFAWAGDEPAVEAWKIAGFKPVVISATDITTSLQTGMIQAVDTTPLAALSFQWHRHAKYMTNVQWAPLIGALFVSKKTWEKIPAELRPKLIEYGRESAAKLSKETRKLSADAIATMKKDGLTVVETTPADIAKWQATAEKAYPYIREKVVPSEWFDEVKKARDEYAAQKK